MDWKEAKEKTLQEWLRIRDRLGVGEPVELVTDINAVSDLCEKAQEKAGSAAERCGHCIAFGDTRICEEYRFRLGELVLEEKWDSARGLVIEIIDRVRRAEVPREAGSRVFDHGEAT